MGQAIQLLAAHRCRAADWFAQISQLDFGPIVDGAANKTGAQCPREINFFLLVDNHSHTPLGNMVNVTISTQI